jgi:hypothetical protein
MYAGEDGAARPAFGAVVEPALDTHEDARDAKPVDQSQHAPKQRMREQRIGERARRQQRDEAAKARICPTRRTISPALSEPITSPAK